MKIYADHAATTKLDEDAFEAMKPYLLEEYGNASQPYSFARAPKAALQSARAAIAKCINAEPDEIYFTSGGTESDNWAIKSMARTLGKSAKLYTSPIEHHAVLNSFAALQREGYGVNYLDVDSRGKVLTESIDAIPTDSSPLFVSVMMASNELGTIEPVKELCGRVHAKGGIFHTDAVQALGHIPVNVKDLGVDLLSASAHKFNGPKGVGFLYIKHGTKLIPYEDGGAQESGMRAGTENIAYIVAMATALEKSCARMAATADHLKGLEQRLQAQLKAGGLDFIRNGGPEWIPGNMSLSFKDTEGEMLLHRLDLMGIAVSTGSACDSKNTQLSHVLKAIHASKEYAYGTIRISLGYENTEEEVDYIVRCVIKILG